MLDLCTLPSAAPGTREETFFDDIQLRVNRSIESRVERRALDMQLSIAKVNRAKLQKTMRLGATVKGGLQGALAAQEELDSPGVCLWGMQRCCTLCSPSFCRP